MELNRKALTILGDAAEAYKEQKETVDIVIAAERLAATVETIVKMLETVPDLTQYIVSAHVAEPEQKSLEDLPIIARTADMSQEDPANIVLEKKEDRQQLREKIMQLHKEGKTIPQIAKEAKTTQKKVQDYLNFERSMKAK